MRGLNGFRGPSRPRARIGAFAAAFAGLVAIGSSAAVGDSTDGPVASRGSSGARPFARANWRRKSPELAELSTADPLLLPSALWSINPARKPVVEPRAV